jgi:hypothetical protein
MRHVRGFRLPRMKENVITLIDDDRSETYATLEEAIRAAQTWYIELTSGKLPIWHYRVESFPEFQHAIGLYKSEIARSLGCPTSRLKLRVEAPAGSTFYRH